LVSKDELKNLIIAIGKKWLFPDFTNKLTWFVVSIGSILLTPASLKQMACNWLVDTVNLNSGVPFTLAEVNSNATDYFWGAILVVSALAHNIGNRYFLYLSSLSDIKGNEQLITADKKLFDEFLTAFPSNSNSITLLKEHDFGDSYHDISTKQIDNFVNYWNNSEHQFLNAVLEEKRKELWHNCHSFLCKLAQYAGPVGAGSFFSVVPDAYRDEDWNQPLFVSERIHELNEQASKCYILHQEMVSLCKKTLKC
jgi:hypothetical protein